MTALTALDLSNNQLTGTLPPTLVARCSVPGVTCALGNNQNLVPPNVAAYLLALPTNLSSVVISSTLWGVPAIGTLPSLASYTALTTLAITGNILTGTIPDTFSALTALQYLDLSSNNLNGTLPSSITSLQSLQCLSVANNYLNGTTVILVCSESRDL